MQWWVWKVAHKSHWYLHEGILILITQSTTYPCSCRAGTSWRHWAAGGSSLSIDLLSICRRNKRDMHDYKGKTAPLKSPNQYNVQPQLSRPRLSRNLDCPDYNIAGHQKIHYHACAEGVANDVLCSEQRGLDNRGCTVRTCIRLMYRNCIPIHCIQCA